MTEPIYPSLSLRNGLRYLIVVAAYGYLLYVLLRFDQYGELADSFRHIGMARMGWLLPVLLLIPLNWLLEALKWWLLIQSEQPYPLREAYRAVLMGITAGFFTPNRVGEPVGRLLSLPKGKRAALGLSLIGILGQSFATVLTGCTACLLLPAVQADQPLTLSPGLLSAVIACLLLLCLLYFFLPELSARVQPLFPGRWKALAEALKRVPRRKLGIIAGLSLLRYLLYALQFYGMLRFFDVPLSPSMAAVLIPIHYLSVSLLPSVSFADLGIRGSVSALVIGSYTEATAAAALAGIGIWVLNYVLPMLLGSVFVARSRQQNDHYTTIQ